MLLRARPFAMTNLLAMLFAVAANFRGLALGLNLGDLGDARWTTTIFEHWFQAFTGGTMFFQANFFHPEEGALGFSDAFFPQALIYSLFRLLGLGIIESWNLANVVFCFLLAAGLAYLAELIFSKALIKFAFIFLGATSLPLVNQLNHVQTFGYAAAVWIVGLLLHVYKFDVNRTSWHLPIAVLLLPVLALSAWYGFYLLAILVALTLLMTVIFNRQVLVKSLRKFWQATLQTRKLYWLASGVGTLLLSVIFVQIYSGSFGLSRSFELYLKYAPRIRNWIDVSEGTGLWASVYSNFGLYQQEASVERAQGFSPFFMLIFVLFALFGFRKYRTIRVLSATTIATWLLVTVLPGGFAPYWLIWEFLPGGTSVRCAFRINIYVFMVALGIVLFVIERWQLKASRRNLLVGLAIAVLAVDQFRVPEANWSSSEYLPERLRVAEASLPSSGCDSFVLGESSSEDPNQTRGVKALHLEVDAIVLASLTGVPTINGYSGTTPIGYPTGLPFDPTVVEKRILWAKGLGVSEVCQVHLDGTITRR